MITQSPPLASRVTAALVTQWNRAAGHWDSWVREAVSLAFLATVLGSAHGLGGYWACSCLVAGLYLEPAAPDQGPREPTPHSHTDEEDHSVLVII